jgi:peptidoglycan hydrolase CwlO-like protein
MEYINDFMVICGWIITIGGAGAVIVNLIKNARKPHKDIEKRLTAIEEDIKDIKIKMDNDYKSINSNREDMNLLMRSVFSLIENKITGNNIEGLKKTRDELIQALTDK